MLTCAARIAEDLSQSSSSRGGEAAGAGGDAEVATWGVLLMSDTPVIEHLARSDAAFRQHLVEGEGRVGHLGQSCQGGCAPPPLCAAF